jgi:thioredoxin-related protein
MKIFSLFIVSAFLFASITWETDLEKAKEKAKKEHKLVLLNFAGSDWCIPCMKLTRQIFENDNFRQFADTSLVMVKADFPRLKKNQLSKDQQKSNDKLADKYNPEGIFPYTLLLDEKGKVLKTWEGFPDLTVGQFTLLIKEFTDVRK